MKTEIEFLDKPVLRVVSDQPSFFDTIIHMNNQGMDTFFDEKTLTNRINLVTRIGDNYHCAKGVYIEDFHICWTNNITMMNLDGNYVAHPFIYLRTH